VTSGTKEGSNGQAIEVPARYSRQVLFEEIGREGQARLMASRAVLVGCGALGTVQASFLVRAGVGTLRIIDRDFVEESNLQRQILFDEEDVKALLPKAVAAENPHPRVQLLGLEDAKAIGHSEEHLVVETPHADRFAVLILHGDLALGVRT